MERESRSSGAAHYETAIATANGFAALLVGVLLLAGGVALLWQSVAHGGIGWVSFATGLVVIAIGALTLAGLYTLQPNEAALLLLFGAYRGTTRIPGLRATNPFYTRRKLSLRARNLNGERLKVNDKRGNPVDIAAVVVWHVDDTAKAAFDVDDYENFVNTARCRWCRWPLEDLSAKQVVTLDDERNAAMVSNLMTVLCAESDVQPVINTGTLYH